MEGVIAESRQNGGCDNTLVNFLQAHQTIRQLCTPTRWEGGTLGSDRYEMALVTLQYKPE